MTEYAIPPASLARLRQALAAFQQLGQIVTEAMGLPEGVANIDLDRGVFVIQDEASPPVLEPQNGQVLEHV